MFSALFGVFWNPCHYLDKLLGVFLNQCHCFGNILMCANISISSYHCLKHFEIYASVGSLLFLPLLKMFRTCTIIWAIFGSAIKGTLLFCHFWEYFGTCHYFGNMWCVIIGLCCFYHYLEYLGSTHHYKSCLAIIRAVDDSLILCYFSVIKADLFA